MSFREFFTEISQSFSSKLKWEITVKTVLLKSKVVGFVLLDTKSGFVISYTDTGMMCSLEVN